MSHPRFSVEGGPSDMREMRYRLLGSSGLRVSELALGTMTFSSERLPRGVQPSPGASWSWCATEEEARGIFARYVERGGNLVDTANVYAAGTAEPLVGELVAPIRDRLVLATKFGLATDPDDVGSGGSSYRSLMRSVEASLRRLDTDWIDLLWLHAWDGMTPLDEVARALDNIVRSGKVLYVGVSDTSAWAIATLHAIGELRGAAPVTAIQTRYSVLDRAAELELLPMASHLGLGVAAFGVIGGGVLSGKYVTDAVAGRRSSGLGPHEAVAAEAVRATAERHGATPTQVAVAWAASAHDGLVPILGARTAAQLEDALGALDLELDDDDHAALRVACPPPVLFPHDVTATIEDQLRGGTKRGRLEVPRGAAFGGFERRTAHRPV